MGGGSVLLENDSYPIGDGIKGNLSRETSSYPGRNGAGGSMCRANGLDNPAKCGGLCY